MEKLIREYLDACDLVDRADREMHAKWGKPESWSLEEKAFLEALVEGAIEHMVQSRGALAAAMDAHFMPTYEWEPRQGSQYYVTTDPAERQRLVQAEADQMAQRTIVRSETRAIEAQALPAGSGAERRRLPLSRAFGPSVPARKREIGFKPD